MSKRLKINIFSHQERKNLRDVAGQRVNNGLLQVVLEATQFSPVRGEFEDSQRSACLPPPRSHGGSRRT